MEHVYIKTEKDHIQAIRKIFEKENEIVIFKNLTVFYTPYVEDINRSATVHFAKLVLGSFSQKKSVDYKFLKAKGNNKGNWVCKVENCPWLSIYMPSECFRKMIRETSLAPEFAERALIKDSNELEVIYFSN